MAAAKSDKDLLEQLFRLLGCSQRGVSLTALTELVSRFVKRVPFENISKLYYRKRFGQRSLPDLRRYVEGVERLNFGGTCYANNYYLHRLLKHLGYDAALCGADMTNPDVHVVNIVSLEGREFLVDAGYAAPFLQPLPRDAASEQVVVLGNDRYVLHPRDAQGRSRLDLFRNGELRHGYTVKPEPREIDYFAAAIAGSYRPEATFMNALLAARFFDDHAIVIHNLTLMESGGSECRLTSIPGWEALPGVVEEHFSIPAAIVAEAVSDLDEPGDAWT